MARAAVNGYQRPHRANQTANGQEEEEKRVYDDQMRQIMIVLAILLVTTASQISVNPPGGTFSETSKMAGKSILSYKNESIFDFFSGCNIGCYVFAFSVIVLSMISMASKCNAWTKFMMILIWIALTLSAITFLLPTILMNKKGEKSDGKIDLFQAKAAVAAFIWWAVMIIILLIQIYKFVVQLRQ